MDTLHRLLDGRRGAIAFVAAATLLLRLQTLFIPFYNGDEANYAGHALVMLDSGVPYVDFVEKKPPLIYCYYWLLFRGLGVSLPAVHFVTILWVLATCWFLYRAVACTLSRVHAGAAAAVYGIFSTCFVESEVLAANCEIIANLPAAIAAYAFLRGRTRDLVGAGVFVGIAFLFKHQAGIELVAILACLALRSRIRGLLLVGAGFLTPIAVVIVVYARLGLLAELYEWNVLVNLGYAGARRPFTAVALHGLWQTTAFIVANLLPFAAGAALLGRRVRQALSPAPLRFAALWLALCLIAVSVGGRFYGHYYVQLYCPLALLGGIGAGEALVRRRELPPWLRRCFVVLLIVPALAFQVSSLVRFRRGDFEGSLLAMHESVGREIRGRSAPEDKIFVWGNYSYAYYFANRVPATRFIVCEYVLPYWEHHLHGDTPFDPAELTPYHHANFARMMADLRKNRPRVIVDTSTSPEFPNWAPFAVAKFPELRSFIDGDYDAVALVHGMVVYQRRRGR